MIAPIPGMHHHNEREWGKVPEGLGQLESIPVSISRCALCDPVLLHYKTARAIYANGQRIHATSSDDGHTGVGPKWGDAKACDGARVTLILP